MKNAVVVFVSGALGCLTLLFVMMISGRMNRSVELQSQLPAAMEMTVEQMMQPEQMYAAGEAAAECMECIAASADTDSDFTVEVYEEDIGKGELAIRMVEEFSYPNGRVGSAECQRMVIYNCVPEPAPAGYVVRFYESREKMQSGEAVIRHIR